MEKITITYDKEGNTLDVWFAKPRPCVNEEIGNGIILKKDKKGEVIGFEKINYLKTWRGFWPQPKFFNHRFRGWHRLNYFYKIRAIGEICG